MEINLRKFNRSDVESKDKTLKKLMEEISTLKTQLPDFQRDWVWTDSNITNLISSIITGYPIGVAMVLETDEENIAFKSRPIEGVKETGKLPKYLILDGQQRLTSVYSALYNKEPVNTRNEKKKDIKRFTIWILKKPWIMIQN